MLEISDFEKITEKLQDILSEFLSGNDLQTAKYQFKDLIIRMEYIQENISYWGHMRELFKTIILHNISKANKIQGYHYQIDRAEYKQNFERIDFVEILKRQNEVSADEINGYIWVLSTCVFVIADFRFGLIVE